jgi:hypothetical protein
MRRFENSFFRKRFARIQNLRVTETVAVRPEERAILTSAETQAGNYERMYRDALDRQRRSINIR